MGWKSTYQLTREHALDLVFSRLSSVHTMTDSELEDLLVAIGYGDNSDLSLYGYNFLIIENPNNDR